MRKGCIFTLIFLIISFRQGYLFPDIPCALNYWDNYGSKMEAFKLIFLLVCLILRFIELQARGVLSYPVQ